MAEVPTPSPPAEPRRRGRLGRVLWRLVRPFVEPELEALQSRFHRVDDRIGTLADRVESASQELGNRLEMSQRDFTAQAEAGRVAREKLHEHFETRIDQTLGELADLRGSHLAVREQFEEVRDTRLASLARDIQAGHEALEALQGEVEKVRDGQLPRTEQEVASLHRDLTGLQGEMEKVRDERIPYLEQRLEAEVGKARREAVSGLQADVTQIQGAVTALQGELESLRSDRLQRVEADLKDLSGGLTEVQGALQSVSASRLARVEEDLGRFQDSLAGLQGEVENLRDGALPRAVEDLGLLQRELSALLREVEGVRDGRVPELVAGLDRVQGGLSGVQRLAEEIRDDRLPALAARTEWLVTRLHEEMERTGGLVDRLVAGEPLHIAVDELTEASLPEALRASSTRFAEAFRGGRHEILARVEEHLELLAGAAPVLDLGCGRGELLEALQSAGVEARGVDLDPAMVAACRRRGLAAEEGDVVSVLATEPPGSLGAVTALHLFEHLPSGSWASLVDAASRALRGGGLLLVECPNPEALRVGAGLFWLDPTHRVPVHREALAFVMAACGLEVEVNRLLHPFPPEQMLARPEQPPEVQALARRLDEWLSGPRDFLLVARKPRA